MRGPPGRSGPLQFWIGDKSGWDAMNRDHLVAIDVDTPDHNMAEHSVLSPRGPDVADRLRPPSNTRTFYRVGSVCGAMWRKRKITLPINCSWLGHLRRVRLPQRGVATGHRRKRPFGQRLPRRGWSSLSYLFGRKRNGGSRDHVAVAGAFGEREGEKGVGHILRWRQAGSGLRRGKRGRAAGYGRCRGRSDWRAPGSW